MLLWQRTLKINYDKIITTLGIIKKQTRGFVVPSVSQFAYKKDPYLVLISCILSLRTKDKTTVEASNRLFRVAKTPKKLAALSPLRIEKLIYPVGFYRTKARAILEASRRIIEEFNGKVPDNLEDLLGFKGVGRKTANLVLGLGFGMPAICVDTHVHRVSNRLGWVKTRNPEETEFALRKILPRDKWIGINTTLVTFGQNTCVPVSPLCSRCPVSGLCKKVGVRTYR